MTSIMEWFISLYSTKNKALKQYDEKEREITSDF